MLEIVKIALHDDLLDARSAVLAKLDGLSEYDIRRPLTPTGTNMLGLVNHLAAWEAVYLGQIFDRPFDDVDPPIRLAEDFDDWRIHQDETSARVLGRFERVCRHADETIQLLDLDASGYVEWWPRPEVTLFSVLLHVLNETNRHAGHIDILREQVDGHTGTAEDEDGELASELQAASESKKIQPGPRAAKLKFS